MKKKLIILMFWGFSNSLAIGQVDSSFAEIVFDTISIENLEIKPYSNLPTDTISIYGNYIHFENQNFGLVIPDSQFISISHDVRYSMIYYADNKSKNILEGTSTHIVAYKDSLVKPDKLFEKDFLSMRLGLLAESMDVESIKVIDIGKDTIGNVSCFWIRSDTKDEFGISKSIMYYFLNPISSRCHTVLISTYSDEQIEDKLCKSINYIKNIKWMDY